VRHLVMCLLAVAVATNVAALEITCDTVIAATSLGATASAMVSRISDPSNSVAPLASGDLERLRRAAVPEEVIRALVARSTLPTRTPPPPSAPALTPLPVPTAGPAAVAPADVVVDGVLLMQATHLGKNRPGSLRFVGEQVVWRDEIDPVRGVVMRGGEIARSWLRCRTVGDGQFCYEFSFESLKKERFRFQDARVGEAANDAVVRIKQAFRERFPRIELGEQLDP
jgi:hypothetical protein